MVPKTYFPALTGVRALAAYAVFWHHARPFADQPDSLAFHLLRQGYAGVSLFFVLSGFLICYRYDNQAIDLDNRFWRGYLQNRFARIYPLYALLLTLTVAIGWWRHQPLTGWVVVANYTLVKGFFNDLKFSGIAQSWSLTVEECFYLSAPVLFGLVRRWSAGGLAAGLLAVGVGLYGLVGQRTAGGFMGSLPLVFFYTFFGRAFEFLTGVWLAQRYTQNRLPSIARPTLAGLLLMAGCIAVQTLIQQRVIDQNLLIYSELITYNFLLPVGIVLFFQGLLTEPTGWQRLLGSRLFQLLGVSSYAFYLIHNGVINKLLTTLIGPHPVVVFGVLIGLSYGLYRLVEAPLQRWLRHGGPTEKPVPV